MKPKAIFTYNIDKENKKLFISDLYSNLSPTMTVTNDMENVLADIENKESVNLENYYITYSDSYNNIDGVKFVNRIVEFFYIDNK